MIPPPIPMDETARLEDLRTTGILDTPPEPFFDSIPPMAARAFRVENAGLSFVDRRRQWFKARTGPGPSETSREVSFAGHAILQDGPFVVPDALLDERFSANPFVTGPDGVRFFAAIPVHGQAGTRIGALSVWADKPLLPGAEALETLGQLAHLISTELASRASDVRSSGGSASSPDQANDLSPGGSASPHDLFPTQSGQESDPPTKLPRSEPRRLESAPTPEATTILDEPALASILENGTPENVAMLRRTLESFREELGGFAASISIHTARDSWSRVLSRWAARAGLIGAEEFALICGEGTTVPTPAERRNYIEKILVPATARLDIAIGEFASTRSEHHLKTA